MDPVLFAIIIVVAVAGPCVLALLLWANRDLRLSKRRAAEHSGDTNQEHVQRPFWQGWLYTGGGHGTGGVGGGGHIGGGGGGDGGGASG
jgi:hypothetical protein